MEVWLKEEYQDVLGRDGEVVGGRDEDGALEREFCLCPRVC
jgi:hypothetical protein